MGRWKHNACGNLTLVRGWLVEISVKDYISNLFEFDVAEQDKTLYKYELEIK